MGRPAAEARPRLSWPSRLRRRGTRKVENIRPYATEIAVTSVSNPAVTPLRVLCARSWSTLLKLALLGTSISTPGTMMIPIRPLAINDRPTKK